MRLSPSQLWQAYQEKKEARKRAIVARFDLDQWIDGVVLYRRRFQTVSDDEYFHRLAERMLDYAHATYDPSELAKFLVKIARNEQELREYDASLQVKVNVEA